MPANLEVVKIAYRQTKDGYAITLLLHPNEEHDLLAAAPIGTRFGAAFIPIADDETTEET